MTRTFEESMRAYPNLLNADLHCHSIWSDGVLTPPALVARAKAGGVELFALTDHDEVSGVASARQAAQEAALPFLAGVEVSVTWAGETIHIVGLGVDPLNAELVEGLRRTRSGRDQRAIDMAGQLAKVGIPGAYEGAIKFAGNPALLSRTHFARFLVESGVCKDVSEVFTRFLVQGRPGYVEQRWAKLSEALEWIHGAGGVAVVAHPARYRIGDLARDQLIEEFKQLGGEGLEVVCGSHTPAQYEQFARSVVHYGLLASRGSDFHAPTESHIDLGALPPLPPKLRPIWSSEQLIARVQ
jgi:3',5'-nucleoside bisphosphate phosphatase